jgi:non-specific protein-tyrosine kinase
MEAGLQDQIDTDAFGAESSLDLHRYIYQVWRWLWLFLLAPAVAGGIAYSLARRIPPVYAAQTTILINESQEAKGADYFSLMLSERHSLTYARLMTTRATLTRVEAALILPPNSIQAVTAIPIKNNTEFIQVRAEHEDPEMAAQIVNTLVRVFSEEVVETLNSGRFEASKATLQQQADKIEAQIESTGARIQGSWNESEKASLEMRNAQYMQIYASLLMSLEQVRMAELRSTSNVLLLDPAMPNLSPIRPRTKRMVAMAMFMGLLLAAGLVFGLNALDNTVKDPEDLARQLGLPIQGVIPIHDTGPGEMIAEKQPRSPVTEAFRSLRTNVRFAGVDHPIRRLMITSPMPVDGKTTVAVNLAIVLAQSGMRVCLIDADMRRSMVHKALALTNGSRANGLSRLFLQDNLDIDSTLLPTGTEGLLTLPAGPHPPNPSELLGSGKMKEILDKLLESADILVLDTPPIMSVTDAAIMAGLVDGALVVFRPGMTKMMAMKQAIGQLMRVNAKIIGLVANNGQGYADYYYREHYSKYSYHSHEHGSGAGWFLRTWQKAVHLAGWGSQ